MQAVVAHRRQNSPRVSSHPNNEDLARAEKAANRLYRKFPNVVGISTGTKYTKRSATDYHAAIQFYVRRKVAPRRKSHTLPRFVYGRFKNGKVNRKSAFHDGRDRGWAGELVCRAGSSISASFGLTRQKGRITFAFKNKVGRAPHNYVISCAHVLGDIDAATSIPAVIDSECCPDVEPFATTLFSSSQVGEEVEYDIAIAEVSDTCTDVADGEVAGTTARIRSFMAIAEIVPSLPVACALPLSNAKKGVVSSDAGSVTVEYRRGVYEVGNAWLMKAERRVREGDSGGLIYAGDVGIGVVFASSGTSDGWAWFHPLRDAFDFIRQNVNLKLECFGS